MNAKKLLIYRGSFIVSLALLSVWVATYVILIEVIFSHTPTLSGWSKGEVLLITSFFYFIQNISDMFFKDGFEEFHESVRRGELDFKLTKPASSRLLLFFGEMRFDYLGGLIPTSFFFIYAIKNIQFSVSVIDFFYGFSLAFFSIVLYFSILSIIATFAFWLHRNTALNTLIFNVTQVSRYPRQMYGNVVAKIISFGIPLALLASIPAEVTVRFNNGYMPVFFVAITAFFYALSKFFWHYGLRKYTSAN